MSSMGGILLIALCFSMSAKAAISLNYTKELNSQIKSYSFKKLLKKNDLIFIGGEHDENYEAFIKKIALKIRELDSDYNCMTWEESDMHATNMMRAHLDWKAFVDQFYKIDLRVGKIFSSVFGFHPDPRQIIPKNIKPLVEAGIINIPIDHSYTDLDWLKKFKLILSYTKESTAYWDGFVQLIFNDRQQHMSKKIISLHKGGVCNKIIVSIAADHLFDDVYSHKSKVKTPGLQNYFPDLSSMNIFVDNVDKPVVKPNRTNRFKGHELKEFLKPVEAAHTKRWIDKIHNLKIIKPTDLPEPRTVSMEIQDYSLQKGVQILIDRGLIKENTLVLSDTGHDLPIAVQIASNQDFRVLKAFNFAEFLRFDDGNNVRILAQLQSWSHKIAEHVKPWKDKKNPNLVFVGLEGHRKDYNDQIERPISPDWLPNNEELKKMGIKQVVYLYERHPDFKEIKPMDDIQKYLDKINLPLKLLGTDCRRAPGC